jgi:hypothetical protein
MFWKKKKPVIVVRKDSGFKLNEKDKIVIIEVNRIEDVKELIYKI